MGIGAALIARPAGRPGGDVRGVAHNLAGVLGRLQDLCATAVADSSLMDFGEASGFAGQVEEISRAVEYLQLVAAGAVDRTRKEAAAAGSARVLDDGYRKTGEFLRDRLQISAAEAHRRLSLAGDVLPRTGMTGQPLPPVREELAAAVAAGAVPSRSATIIAQALGRVRGVCDPETAARMEHAVTRTAAEHDPDFLARIARRWLDAIDQDGAEPSEELLRQLQGAFIRKPRHGLQHLEIFATTEQFEHLLTVMNTATNPRTAAAGAGGAEGESGGSDTAAAESAGTEADGAAGTDAGGFVPNQLDRRSRPQKLLDGLVGGCKAALASGGLPAAGGLRPQVMVTIDYRDLLDRLGSDGDMEAGGPGRTANNCPDASGQIPGTGPFGLTGTGTMAFTGPVTAATIRKIACDADIIPLLLGSQGRILDIGRTSRIFPPHIRKALTARDQGCAFPACTIPAPWCEAHHITYWAYGGTTSTDNGTLLCSHHHHLIHKEQWTIQPRNGIPWFIPPPHLDPHQTPRRNHYFRT
ncbi:DUF222 domain-containing protein [Arthrobacter sp. KBS0702]|uniref:HNH endonuclease signature motif containing protein n=1 Tax=Arthrobacter sp. KBS0702 TaxID=2578107 RepID=UPI00110EA23A|nr:DUF222 domain-containing protein [Arthrobacter sp. KBS0702]